ncbi:PREDICTED: uncharacterized protein LOC103074528 [Lipotes vexillifer]|uniref:Uncharacterized protein LOC103074528 n=1 Tax=Lipotes vexillifer TaxID=118797 RepID=A0A340XLN8_LIPVE|nr:PREDICTED: uncharacterized protein LOC103074528 [Lipotes vexillifer]
MHVHIYMYAHVHVHTRVCVHIYIYIYIYIYINIYKGIYIYSYVRVCVHMESFESRSTPPSSVPSVPTRSLVHKSCSTQSFHRARKSPGIRGWNIGTKPVDINYCRRDDPKRSNLCFHPRPSWRGWMWAEVGSGPGGVRLGLKLAQQPPAPSTPLLMPAGSVPYLAAGFRILHCSCGWPDENGRADKPVESEASGNAASGGSWLRPAALRRLDA